MHSRRTHRPYKGLTNAKSVEQTTAYFADTPNARYATAYEIKNLYSSVCFSNNVRTPVPRNWSTLQLAAALASLCVEFGKSIEAEG